MKQYLLKMRPARRKSVTVNLFLHEAIGGMEKVVPRLRFDHMVTHLNQRYDLLNQSIKSLQQVKRLT
jgi:hypothetical protein